MAKRFQNGVMKVKGLFEENNWTIGKDKQKADHDRTKQNETRGILYKQCRTA